MKNLFQITLALTVIMSASLARGAATLAGPSGLSAIPTAAVTPAGQLQVSADWYNTNESWMNDTIPFEVLYGVYPNVEVGVNGLMTKVTGQDANSLGLNAKYRLPVMFGGADWAVGGIAAVTQQGADSAYTNDARIGELYVVATRPIIPTLPTGIGLHGTLGVNWNKFDAGAVSGDGFRGLAGLELQLPMQTCLSLEYQTARPQVGDDKPLSSLLVRHAITPAFGVQVGYTNAGINYAGLTGASKHQIIAGLTYKWGGDTYENK